MTAARDSVRTRIALMLVPVTLLFAALELGLRLLPQPPPDTVLDRIVVPDPDLLWKLRPADAGPLATNALGLRDTPYRAAADVRILVIGDSVSWGDGIDEVTRTFPYLLERRLSAHHPERTFEVVNAGVPGYTTEQEATWLELHGLDLEPHAVVVQVSLNDVITRPPWLARWRGREAVRVAYGFLLRHSRVFAALARAMQQRARAQETTLVQELVQPTWSPVVERAWGRMLAQLDRIRTLADARHAPVVLLVAPDRSQVEDPQGRRHPQDALAAYAAAHGMRYVDVLHALETLPPEAATRSFHDQSHFSRLGHDVVADLLLAPVGETLGLPEGDPTPRLADKVQAYALTEAAQRAAARGDLPQAAALLSAAERLAPDVGLVYQFQSNVAYLMGDRERAIAALRRGLLLEPDTPLFRRNLAAIGAAR